MKVILMVGVPGSGKSTLAKEYAEKYSAEILSSDKIREELFGSEEPQEKNWLIFKILYERGRKFLDEGKNIIIDSTNVDRKTRKTVFRNFQDYTYEKVAVVKNIDIKEAKKRNRNRDRFVPEEVIEKFQEKFQMPTLEEFDEVIIDTN